MIRLRGGQTRNRDSVLFTVQEIFVLCRASILALRTTKISIHCVSEALSPGIKRPDRKAKYMRESSAEVKNEWSYSSTLSRAFIACKGANLIFTPLNFKGHFTPEVHPITGQEGPEVE